LPERLSAAPPPTVSREFTFPGDTASLVPAREAIMDVLRDYCSSEAEEIDLFLALQEALANAVRHGCRDDPAKQIFCSVQVDPAAFTIGIRDSGAGFDAQRLAAPGGSAPNLSESGRGIFLMRSVMDEVTHGRGGSEVRLRKLRAPAASSA